MFSIVGEKAESSACSRACISGLIELRHKSRNSEFSSIPRCKFNDSFRDFGHCPNCSFKELFNACVLPHLLFQPQTFLFIYPSSSDAHHATLATLPHETHHCCRVCRRRSVSCLLRVLFREGHTLHCRSPTAFDVSSIYSAPGRNRSCSRAHSRNRCCHGHNLFVGFPFVCAEHPSTS